MTDDIYIEMPRMNMKSSTFAEFVKKIDELEKENKQLKKFCEEFNALNVSKENQKLKEELSRESYKVSEAYCFVEELKELLKECENSILYYQETYGAMDLDTYTLLAKLKEVLK